RSGGWRPGTAARPQRRQRHRWRSASARPPALMRAQLNHHAPRPVALLLAVVAAGQRDEPRAEQEARTPPDGEADEVAAHRVTFLPVLSPVLPSRATRSLTRSSRTRALPQST